MNVFLKFEEFINEAKEVQLKVKSNEKEKVKNNVTFTKDINFPKIWIHDPNLSFGNVKIDVEIKNTYYYDNSDGVDRPLFDALSKNVEPQRYKKVTYYFLETLGYLLYVDKGVGTHSAILVRFDSLRELKGYVDSSNSYN